MRSARSPKPLAAEAGARYARYKAALRVAGLTDAELGRRLALNNRQHLNRIVTSKTPGTAIWPRIAKALKVDPAWLLTGNGEPPRWAPPGNELAAAYALLDVVATLVRQAGKGAAGKIAIAAIETAKNAVTNLG